jgi:succinate dehydrogenase/fumarate reductase flavoprotein subunit
LIRSSGRTGNPSKIFATRTNSGAALEFYDTIKGGDFRSREANVHRLAECSAQLIDQAVAQVCPFAREYGGYLSNRSFGGVQVSRTNFADHGANRLGANSLLQSCVDGYFIAPSTISNYEKN